MISNRAHVELKAARSAGDFSLTLTIKDSPSGEAERARWTFEKGQKPQIEQAGRNETLVVATLRQEFEANPAAPKPLSTATLRARARIGTTALAGALRTAETAGRARQILKGAKSLGWLYVPGSGEVANGGIRTDPNSSRPVERDRGSDPNSPPIGGFGSSPMVGQAQPNSSCSGDRR
jgi:hypothetical protein